MIAMTKTYELREAATLTDVSPRQIRRWADAGVISVGGGGSQGTRRDYTFRNLVEIVVCDELRIGRVAEPGLRTVVESLNAVWDQPDDPMTERKDGPTYRDATMLWLAFQRGVLPDGTAIENVGHYPVNEEELLVRTRAGETGIMIPFARIIRDLESATGETFDVASAERRALVRALTGIGDE